MATTLGATGLTLPTGGEILRGATLRSLRWTSTTSASQTAQAANNVYMSMEVTMPPAASDTSIFLCHLKSNFDDSNSATRGCGLSLWVEQDDGNGNQQWVSRQGEHCYYNTGSFNVYWHIHHTILDTGTLNSSATGSTPAVRAGDQRRYRVYNLQNNDNMISNKNGITNQSGASGLLMVLELDGSFLLDGYN